MNFRQLFTGAALVAAMSIAVAAHAGTAVLTYKSNSGEALANGPFTLGWQFQVNKPLRVDSLGVFDADLDGLAETHDVGIWDSSGNLVASATVDSGTTDTLIDNFRYTDIAPVSLADGTYFIGALWLDGSDPMVFTDGGGALSTISAVSYLSTAYTAGGTLADPVNTDGGGPPGYFGPNFTASVPEPATWAMMLFGVGLVGAGIRTSRRKSVSALSSI